MLTNNSTSHTKRYPALLVFLLASVGFLAGCNTVAGVGEDVEAAGDAIEDKAEEKKNY